MVVSENSVGIGREKLREIRAKLHYLFTDKKDNFSHVNGLLSYTYSVDKKSYNKLYFYINNLKQKHPLSSAVNELNPKISKPV